MDGLGLRGRSGVAAGNRAPVKWEKGWMMAAVGSGVGETLRYVLQIS
jgi:hypothetical protein